MRLTEANPCGHGLRLGSMILLPFLALAANIVPDLALADPATYLDCRSDAANLKTGKRIEVSSGDLQFGFRGSEILDEDNLCKGKTKLSYEISEGMIFIQCRGEDVSYEMSISRANGEFRLLSRSISDPNVYIEYVGSCEPVDRKF